MTKSKRRKQPDDRPAEGEPGWYPKFPPPPIERGSHMSDAQWEAAEKDRADYYDKMGRYLRMFQLLCRAKGAPKTCRIGRCRRRNDCLGRRDPDDWSFFVRPLIPPCVPLDLEIVTHLREEIMREARYLEELERRKGGTAAASS